MAFTHSLMNLDISLRVMGLMLASPSVLLFLNYGKLQVLINKKRLSSVALIMPLFRLTLLKRLKYGEGRFEGKCWSNAPSLP